MRSLGPSTAIFRRLAVPVITLAVLVGTAQAQSFNVIYNFTGGLDGDDPWGNLAIDAAGSLYIGATQGGLYGAGAADKLKRTSSGGWVLQPLYDFRGGNGDGSGPQVVLAADGAVFGATEEGGPANSGIVFQLRPSPTFPRTALAPWNETVLYSFEGGSDGATPGSPPIFDSAGNLYGTTVSGGGEDAGTVYELVPSDQGYAEQVLYRFSDPGPSGSNPAAGLVADSSFTNLYGVAAYGGSIGFGTVFRLTKTGSNWTESVLYNFHGGADGAEPFTGLALDSSGNLYGAAARGGSGGGGTIFKLTPSGAGYTFSLLYSGFSGNYGPMGGALTLDSAGNIYGTTYADGAYGYGSVFRLTPSDGGYTYTDLHDFTGGADGAIPAGGITEDANGNLYGTTRGGGAGDNGVIFKITP
jgi:uncharacterized repeat protein (TIGR03803 family)